MPSKTKVKKEDEIKEFAILINEFANGLPVSKIESRDSFLALMKKETPRGIRKSRAEWQQLFDLFMAKPVSLSWAEWLEKNNGGKK